eukprot:584104-Pleurochrysis_carterae.AAC.1
MAGSAMECAVEALQGARSSVLQPPLAADAVAALLPPAVLATAPLLSTAKKSYSALMRLSATRPFIASLATVQLCAVWQRKPALALHWTTEIASLLLYGSVPGSHQNDADGTALRQLDETDLAFYSEDEADWT